MKEASVIDPTLVLAKEGEIVELFSDIGVILTEDLLSNLEGAFTEWLGVFVFAAFSVQNGQIVERRRHRRMFHA